MQENECKKCGYVAKTKAGLRLHQYKKHTRAGRAQSKKASQIMHRAKRKPGRRGGLALAVARDEVNFCPKCGFHLEKVAIAMAFDPNEA